MTKFMKFNDGEITVDFNKSVHVEVDVKHNKTLLEIPGIPADYQDSKKVQVTAPTLAHTNRFFIAADDHKGNSVLTMVQGTMSNDSLKKRQRNYRQTIYRVSTILLRRHEKGDRP